MSRERLFCHNTSTPWIPKALPSSGTGRDETEGWLDDMNMQDIGSECLSAAPKASSYGCETFICHPNCETYLVGGNFWAYCLNTGAMPAQLAAGQRSWGAAYANAFMLTKMPPGIVVKDFVHDQEVFPDPTLS